MISQLPLHAGVNTTCVSIQIGDATPTAPTAAEGGYNAKETKLWPGVGLRLGLGLGGERRRPQAVGERRERPTRAALLAGMRGGRARGTSAVCGTGRLNSHWYPTARGL